MENIRAFIAVNLNVEIREFISSLKNCFNSEEFKVKWVEKNNLHLTLKFLSYISPDQIKLVSLSLKEITNQFNPFLLKLSSDIGVFPTYQAPRIVWVGIKEGTNELIKLYNSIEILLHKRGFSKENKKFSSHITIGRIKYIKDKNNLINILEDINVKCISQEVKSIELMESKLTPSGPIYSILDTFTLKMQKII